MDKAASRIRLLLECKTNPFAAKCSPFRISKIAHWLYTLTYCAVYQQYLCCTRKTQEFRVEHRLARSAGSFERSEMQILYLKQSFSCGVEGLMG